MLIEKNAFKRPPLHNIVNISFSLLPTLEFQRGAFNGLTKLARLTLLRIPLLKFSYNTMNQIANTLMLFTATYVGFPSNMYNVIGSVQLNSLRQITFRNIKGIYRIITRNSITNVPLLKYLILPDSGIEVIEAGAFDSLKENLVALSLQRNKLRTLPAYLFVEIYVGLYKSDFIDNEWDCDCALALISSYKNYFYSFGCADDEIAKLHETCTYDHIDLPNATIKSRKCIDHYGTNSLRITFSTKFLIRVKYIEGIIYLKVRVRAQFYLLAFSKSMVGSAMICFTSTAKYSAIALHKILVKDEVISVCLMNDETAVWPLNCVSFRYEPFKSSLWLDENETIILIIGFTIGNMMVFMISICIGIWFTIHNPFRVKNKKPGAGKVTKNMSLELWLRHTDGL